MSCKISIITVVFNGSDTIRECLESVSSQTCKCEHIVIDGASTDGTLDIVKEYPHVTRIISEKDNGIYDAMNKGLAMASGEIVGILNADDIYTTPSVLDIVFNEIAKSNAESCYGDLAYVDKNNTDKVIRRWKSGEYRRERFNNGWMPPHPAFFVKKRVYEMYGNFDLRFPLAADYEFMLRVLYKYNISTSYIPEYLVKMRTGGSSAPGIVNTSKMIKENIYAWKVNGLRYRYKTFFLKPISKILQYNGGIIKK